MTEEKIGADLTGGGTRRGGIYNKALKRLRLVIIFSLDAQSGKA